jgi:glycosyltransferase involved in cell wall biosynthesis
VLLVTQNLNLEGAPLFLWEYARHLAASGGATLQVISSQEGPLRARFEALGASVRLLDASRLQAAPSAPAVRRELRGLAAQLDLAGVKLVVANTVASFWAVLAAHAAGRPSLLYIHESTPPEAFFPRRAVATVLPSVRAAFAAATRVSFLTEATRRYYDDLAVRPNYCVNPGWIDLRAIDAFRTAHPRSALRTQFGVERDELLVVNIGSVCERKGQTIFARAVDLLGRLDPALAGRARFLMIGGRDTLYDRDLAELLQELRRPNLQVRPETPDVYAWYAAADLFVCTSYEESFPRVILEAMGFALPIVSTDVHGIPEIVRDGQEAVLVPPGDTQALATAMGRVLLNPARAGEFSARARRRVEAAFALEHQLPRHHALAGALAAGHA